MSEPISTNVAYSDSFFDSINVFSDRSARVLVPLIVEWFNPKSVLDVGCGEGAWLQAFAQTGITDVRGIDGSYVDRSRLRIQSDRFQAVDLSGPFRMDRTFDLALSLEVGEHLPPASAAGFVQSLAEAAPLVVFSAAIPQQGGTSHVNEQWPSYWAKLFASNGFVCIDALRGRIWNDPEIAFWYRQNLLLFVRSDRAAGVAERLGTQPVEEPLPLVHPEMFAYVTQMWKIADSAGNNAGVREASKKLLSAIARRCGGVDVQ